MSQKSRRIKDQPSAAIIALNNELPKFDKPRFEQTFTYHLKDVPLENFNDELEPTGNVIIHLPDISSVLVPINPKMTVAKFKEKVSQKIDFYDKEKHILVTSNGMIKDGFTLEEIDIKENTDILIIKKGVSTEEDERKRNYYVSRRLKRCGISGSEAASEFGSSRAYKSPRTERTEKTPDQLIKIRRTLSQRSRFGSKYSFKII
ncbi:hypothetical protein TRFO_38932 [Tritrichomonas foetus]|uniref:Ubiquitin-like domain-containing protein n=1 Tax=Tritrichomonas foetus TaxID=1144522 RepID=A0A1J4J8A2_9EUKA|nr:hypothetical protein TRFO_38932 [Tritrichomonas foetus]|eukprot:OHS94913.1 hypothetical protein TRFO_38932 [Tritrichomonas foetus]